MTGAASGLGAAMARQFAEELCAVGRRAVASRVDVGDPGSLAMLATTARAELGGCDLLAANVGVQRIGHSETLTRDDWQWVIGVDVPNRPQVEARFRALLDAFDRAAEV